HLPGANAKRTSTSAEHDCVRLDELGDAPREEKIGKLRGGRRSLGDDLEIVGPYALRIGRLNEKAATDGFHIPSAVRPAVLRKRNGENADVRFACDHGQRIVGVRG